MWLSLKLNWTYTYFPLKNWTPFFYCLRCLQYLSNGSNHWLVQVHLGHVCLLIYVNVHMYMHTHGHDSTHWLNRTVVLWHIIRVHGILSGVTGGHYRRGLGGWFAPLYFPGRKRIWPLHSPDRRGIFPIVLPWQEGDLHHCTPPPHPGRRRICPIDLPFQEGDMTHCTSLAGGGSAPLHSPGTGGGSAKFIAKWALLAPLLQILHPNPNSSGCVIHPAEQSSIIWHTVCPVSSWKCRQALSGGEGVELAGWLTDLSAVGGNRQH